MGKKKQKAAEAEVATKSYDVEALREGLVRVGIALPSDVSPEEMAEALRVHFRQVDEKRNPDEKDPLVECEIDGCKEISLREFDRCPFCGKGEEDVAVEADPGPPPGAEIPDPEDEPQAGDEPEGVSAEVIPPPEARPLVQVQRGKKPGIMPEGEFDKSLSPLDRYIAEVKYLRNVAETGCYLMAKKLAEGADSGVWKTRLDPKQKPVYRNFETFAQVEIGMSGRYVREQLNLYKMFTEEQFRKIPPTKLRLIAQASPEVVEEVKKAALEGKSRRDIEREHMGRQPGGGDKRPKGPKAKRKVPEKRADGKLTVVLAEGKQKFAFHTKESAKTDSPKPAKRVGEIPWAVLPISANGVEVLLTISLNPKGEFVGVVEVRRAEVAAPAK